MPTSKWVANWWSSSQQRVVMNEALSDWVPLNTGAPEDRFPGPELLTVYTNNWWFVTRSDHKTMIGNIIIFHQDIQSLRRMRVKFLGWSHSWEFQITLVMKDGIALISRSPSNIIKLIPITSLRKSLNGILNWDVNGGFDYQMRTAMFWVLGILVSKSC